MYYGTGRRKTSSARIFMKKGKGNIFINYILLNNYYIEKINRIIIMQPFRVLSEDFLYKNYDFLITVKGGGISSQVIAIRHGISRLLLKFNSSFKKKLRLYGFITRDSRKVERKKYGLRKSRSRHQYSKR